MSGEIYERESGVVVSYTLAVEIVITCCITARLIIRGS